MKTCFKCNRTLPLFEFYKHPQMKDGYFNKCKECSKSENRKNRSDKVEYYREYDRVRFQEDPNRKKGNERYARTDRGREVGKAARKKYIKNNPEKRAAHILLGNAVRDGRITKPRNCEKCGKDCSGRRKIHAHHEDYCYPLEVVWLCPICHRKRHQEIDLEN